MQKSLDQYTDKPLRVIIAGSRDFDDYELVKSTMDSLHLNIGEIISGNARGADLLGERYANEKQITVHVFPVTHEEWQKSRAAGFRRNEKMALYADLLVAFNMGTPGTENMIMNMKKLGKPMYVIKI
jgi:hypothetical protein